MPSPTNINNSFDKSRLEQAFNLCSTPKSHRSHLSLIPEIVRGRSQSSSNLENLACLLSRDNYQEQCENRKLKTEEDDGNGSRTPPRNASPIKKNSQVIGTKIRPVKPMKKWKM
jgi:hypothetical protein